MWSGDVLLQAHTSPFLASLQAEELLGGLAPFTKAIGLENEEVEDWTTEARRDIHMFSALTIQMYFRLQDFRQWNRAQILHYVFFFHSRISVFSISSGRSCSVHNTRTTSHVVPEPLFVP